jgi:hypothetical protein
MNHVFGFLLFSSNMDSFQLIVVLFPRLFHAVGSIIKTFISPWDQLFCSLLPSVRGCSYQPSYLMSQHRYYLYICVTVWILLQRWCVSCAVDVLTGFVMCV